MSNNSSVVPPVIYTYSETANIVYGLFSVTLFLIGKTISEPKHIYKQRIKASTVDCRNNIVFPPIGLEEHQLSPWNS